MSITKIHAIARYEGKITSSKEAEIHNKLEVAGGEYLRSEGGDDVGGMRTIIYTFITFDTARDVLNILQNWGYWVEIHEPGGLKHRYIKKPDCRVTHKRRGRRRLEPTAARVNANIWRYRNEIKRLTDNPILRKSHSVKYYENKLRIELEKQERLRQEAEEEKRKFHYRELPDHVIQKHKDAALQRAFPARAIAKALAASDPSDWDN